MRIIAYTKDWPFAVFANSKHEYFVVNQETEETVASKLTEKQAYVIAHEKALELDIASRGN